MSDLPERQKRFVDEYLADPNLNATAAYRRAYPACKTDGAASAAAARLLGTVKVQAAIEAAVKARSDRVQVTQDDVLRRLWMIATADPNELIEYRRTCCRHCWGTGFGYQRTPAELARDRAHHGKETARAVAAGKPAPDPFDEAGGSGYDRTRAPNPACPECHGEGEGTAFPKDTRTLSPAARVLYAGVKVTKEGIEVKMHDQAAALVNAGRHLGMFKDRHELTGADGKPIQHDHTHDATAEFGARLAALTDAFARAGRREEGRVLPAHGAGEPVDTG